MPQRSPNASPTAPATGSITRPGMAQNAIMAKPIVRTRAGISRKELAADLGVSGALVSQWEGDDSLPNVEQFRDITELCAGDWLWEMVKNGDLLMGPEAKDVRAR